MKGPLSIAISFAKVACGDGKPRIGSVDKIRRLNIGLLGAHFCESSLENSRITFFKDIERCWQGGKQSS